jgi:2-isopropylmalate synthase
MAYVGYSAFAHKAGYHASATAKVENAYQHVDPALVGNRQRILVSELSGTSNVMTRTEQLGIKQSKSAAAETANTLKLMESQGFQFEGAEASFELLVRRQEPEYQPPFELVDFLTLVETRGGEAAVSEAMVKIRVGDEVFHTAAEGNGPVSALDAGTRKALLSAYPVLDSVRLVDYKVRIVDSDAGTDASTRVLIDSTNGEDFWTTVGSSTNVVEASWLALADSFEYAIMLEENRAKGGTT